MTTLMTTVMPVNASRSSIRRVRIWTSYVRLARKREDLASANDPSDRDEASADGQRRNEVDGEPVMGSAVL
jgi:hypothetical protein